MPESVITTSIPTFEQLGLPEQLFAAGYSACFIGAMKFVAGRDKQVRALDRKTGARALRSIVEDDRAHHLDGVQRHVPLAVRRAAFAVVIGRVPSA